MRTNSPSILNRVGLLAGTAGLALTLALGGYAMAQTHGSGGSGHDSGSSHESGASHDSGSSHEGGSGGKKMRKGASGERGGGRGGSLRDVFKQMEVEEALDEVRGQRRGQSGETQKGQRGGQAATGKGQRGGESTEAAAEGQGKKGQPGTQAEVPSKPSWAGGSPDEGKPDYGDLYIVVRDADGVPILATPKDVDGNPILVDTDGDGQPDDQLQVYSVDGSILPYAVDAEGDLELVGEAAEAIFSRTSVVRSPDRVLASQYLEFIKLLDAADSVSVDQTNRIVLSTTETDGTVTTVTETSIDSPLIYLALYEAIMTTGTLPDAVERNGDTYVPTTNLLDKLPVELSALKDSTYNLDDRTLSAIFLAAAMDKGGEATADMIVYLNAQLDVATEDNYVSATESDYVKYSDFTYDRATVYADSQITVLVADGVDADGDPQYVTKTVDVLTAVFDGTNVTTTATPDNPDDVEIAIGIAAFTQAVDDARAIIDYVHTYSPPETN